jgi:hypothetical protein
MFILICGISTLNTFTVVTLTAALSISVLLWREYPADSVNSLGISSVGLHFLVEIDRASLQRLRIVLVWCSREGTQQHVRVALPRASTLEDHHPEHSWNQRPRVRI